jgi:hypothetical protein
MHLVARGRRADVEHYSGPVVGFDQDIPVEREGRPQADRHESHYEAQASDGGAARTVESVAPDGRTDESGPQERDRDDDSEDESETASHDRYDPDEDQVYEYGCQTPLR